MSQIEVSISDEVSALKGAYIEAAGEIEAHVRTFNSYNERGKFSSEFRFLADKLCSYKGRTILRVSMFIYNSENALSNDLFEYIQYCDAISDLIRRYEVVQHRQERNEAKKNELEKEKYEIESGGGKAFSIKGIFFQLLFFSDSAFQLLEFFDRGARKPYL